MKIKEWEVVKGQLPFLCLWQQDKTAHHSRRTAAGYAYFKLSTHRKALFYAGTVIFTAPERYFLPFKTGNFYRTGTVIFTAKI